MSAEAPPPSDARATAEGGGASGDGAGGGGRGDGGRGRGGDGDGGRGDGRTQRARPRVILGRIAFALGVLACAHPAVSPPIALALGLTVAIAFGRVWPWGSTRGAQRLLQVSVALLGIRMDIGEMLREAAAGGVFAAATIGGTLALGWLGARMLRVEARTATLISGGTAICGGSAIAAIAPAIGAGGAQIAVAMGTVFVLNGLALYLFPLVGHALDLSGAQFGTWAGVAIHDVSSVVGAATVFGDGALETATTVKLSRALWIVPLAIGAGLLWGRGAPDAPAPGMDGDTLPLAPAVARPRPPLVPWFIVGFVMMSLARTYVPGVVDVAPVVGEVAKTGLTITLFGIGSGLAWSTLRSVGPRALLLGVVLWLAISGASLAVVRATVPGPATGSVPVDAGADAGTATGGDAGAAADAQNDAAAAGERAATDDAGPDPAGRAAEAGGVQYPSPEPRPGPAAADVRPPTDVPSDGG